VDQPSVIIGAGTLGKALAEWGDTGQDVVLGRGKEIPSEIVLTGGCVCLGVDQNQPIVCVVWPPPSD